MNLYRLSRTKSIYILLLCTSLFCLLSCYMERIDYIETQKAETAAQTKTGSDETPDIPDEEEEQGGLSIDIDPDYHVDAEEGNFGIMVQTPEKTDEHTPAFLEYYHANLASGIILLFLIIGCALYVNGEAKCGFIKNIAGQTRHKSYIYISKIITMAVYTAMSMLLYGLVQYIGLRIFLPYHIDFGKAYLSQSWKLLLASFLLHTAFICAISLLVTLTRSTSVGITVGLLVDCGIFFAFIPYLEKLLHVKIQKYMIVTNMQQMLIDTADKTVMKGIGIGGILLLVYLAIGTLYFTKKDVV